MLVCYDESKENGYIDSTAIVGLMNHMLEVGIYDGVYEQLKSILIKFVDFSIKDGLVVIKINNKDKHIVFGSGSEYIERYALSLLSIAGVKIVNSAGFKRILLTGTMNITNDIDGGIFINWSVA